MSANFASEITESKTLVESGKYTEAEELLNSILRKSPQHALALNNLGVIRLKQQRRDEAIKLFQQALIINPSLTIAKNNLRKTNPASRFRKNGILSFIVAAFFLWYWYSRFHSLGINLFSIIFSDPDIWGSFFLTIACLIIAAFTPPLVSLVLFVISAFANGIPSLWGIASLILAALSFYEWRNK